MDALRLLQAARSLADPTLLHRGVDNAILWSLGNVVMPMEVAAPAQRVDIETFWAASTVAAPSPVRVVGELPSRRGGRVRVLDLEGPSQGPGEHPGSAHLLAQARFNTGAQPDAPAVLIIHGFAVPTAIVEDYHANLLTARGAHAVRLDLPFHLRRRAVDTRSGDGFFGADLTRVRDVIRQSVEDAAALVAWMQAEMSPRVAVIGFSLGGLVAALLAARVPMAAALPVIPAADLPEIFMTYAPSRSRARAGMVGDGGGPWGVDRATARRTLDEALAPVVPRRLHPKTEPQRMAIISATHDRVVGGASARRLAHSWGTPLWHYDHGHITVLTAPGLTTRLHSFLLDTAAGDRDAPAETAHALLGRDRRRAVPAAS
ncbi:MAG: hypothetical protein ABR541_05465 [Candidatus Dormibacteria bacterium]